MNRKAAIVAGIGLVCACGVIMARGASAADPSSGGAEAGRQAMQEQKQSGESGAFPDFPGSHLGPQDTDKTTSQGMKKSAGHEGQLSEKTTSGDRMRKSDSGSHEKEGGHQPSGGQSGREGGSGMGR